MGDNNQRAIKGLERLFQDVFRLDVHMVGRLIESKEIVALEHQFGHTETRPLASRKDSDLLVDVLAAKEELRQQVAQLRADISHRNAVQGREYSLVLVKYIFLILSKITYIHIMSPAGLAAYRLKFPHQNPHQSCLSLAVASHEGYLLASFYLDVGVAEHDFLRIANCQVTGLENHVTGARGWRKLNV